MGEFKMKIMILFALLGFASMSLMASENKSIKNLSTFASKKMDGKKLYQKRCALCHGKKAQKSPLRNTPPLAGRDASILARLTITYRDQDNRHGTEHTANRESQIMLEATSSLSNQHISAIATYISGLPKE